MAIVLPKFSRRRPSTGLAAETQPAVRLELCNEDAVFPAESLLTGQWRISRVASDEIQSVELSVLWHTEGKGDEDLQVHFFRRISEQAIGRLDLSQPQPIRCVLPPTPLSYQGHLISVRWCVRLRLYLSHGREIVAEQPFHLVAANRRDLSRDDSSADHGNTSSDLDCDSDLAEPIQSDPTQSDLDYGVTGSVGGGAAAAAGEQSLASDLRSRFVGPILGSKRPARR